MGLETVQGIFHFAQVSPSTTWTITHNLNVTEPCVDFWIDDGGNKTKVLPLTVAATNENVVTATFTAAQSGEAVVV